MVNDEDSNLRTVGTYEEVNYERHLGVIFETNIYNNNHHHHHRTSLEARSGGFFFLDTTKIWLHSDLFTAIFLISPASRDFATKFD